MLHGINFSCLLLCWGCGLSSEKASQTTSPQTTSQKNNIDPGTGTPSSAIDNALLIYEPIVKAVKVDNWFIPQIFFSASWNSEYVSWIVCPTRGQDPCFDGTTAKNSILLPPLQKGSLEISLKSCKGKNICGETNRISWSSPSGKVPDDVAKSYEKIRKIKELGKKAYDLSLEFQSLQGECQGSDDSSLVSVKALSEQISIFGEQVSSEGTVLAVSGSSLSLVEENSSYQSVLRLNQEGSFLPKKQADLEKFFGKADVSSSVKDVMSSFFLQDESQHSCSVLEDWKKKLTILKAEFEMLRSF